MMQITLRKKNIQFYGDGVDFETTYEGNEIVDELSLHIITLQGAYLTNVTDTTYNTLTIANSSDLANYLNLDI